jgi:three-Cys-motif partner protein
MDMNQNVLFEDLSKTEPADIERMNAFWGDESWKKLLYKEQETLFGEIHHVKIEDYHVLAKEFYKRLKQVGFNDVPEPILMRNMKGGPLYYLCFASQKSVAKKIVNDIFDKYRKAY